MSSEGHKLLDLLRAKDIEDVVGALERMFLGKVDLFMTQPTSNGNINRTVMQVYAVCRVQPWKPGGNKAKWYLPGLVVI